MEISFEIMYPHSLVPNLKQKLCILVFSFKKVCITFLRFELRVSDLQGRCSMA
jgi:hypothetical protein